MQFDQSQYGYFELPPRCRHNHVQLNPATAHFKGLVQIILYIEVFTIANIKITVKSFFELKFVYSIDGIMFKAGAL